MGAAGRTSVCCGPGSVRSAQEPEVWYLPEVKTTRKWKEERIYHNEPLWGKKKRKENKFCVPGSGILLTVLKIALVLLCWLALEVV